MANWFRPELEQLGQVLDGSIQKASTHLEGHIDRVAAEISNQRSLTKGDVKELIDYAAERFGEAADQRIERAKAELAQLVTDKLAEVRTELSKSAAEQRRTALTNVMLAFVSALLIAAVSYSYNKLTHGEIDVWQTFRIVLLAVGTGNLVWLVIKLWQSYKARSQAGQDLIVASAQYFGLLRIRGLAWPVLTLMLTIALWVAVAYGERLPDPMQLLR